MSELLSKRSAFPAQKYDILKISQEANRDKESGNTIINASIGAFLNDDKTLGTVDIIKNTLEKNIAGKLGYPAIVGDNEFNTLLPKFLFNKYYDELNNKYSIFTGGTLGGTGAISHAFNLFVEKGANVLLPSIMWDNYKLLANKAEIGYKTYNIFNESNEFDLVSFEETINAELELNGKALVVINDPCENPTGYCLSQDEYNKVFEILNKCSEKGKLIALFDIAYYSFYQINDTEFPLFKMLTKETKFLPVIAFSCSKIFSIYSLRCGAFIALSKDNDEMQSIKRGFEGYARGTYSCPVGGVFNAISKILESQELTDEINEQKRLLGIRSKYMIKLLEDNNIESYPYRSGFFVSIKVKDSEYIYNELKKKHIYVVPLTKNIIRLAICGLRVDEEEILISELKKLL